MNIEIETLKDRIREHMFSHDLTIPEFAEKAKLGTRTIIAILGGRVNITLRTLWKIEHVLKSEETTNESSNQRP